MIVSSSVEVTRALARITSMSAGVTCAGFIFDAKKGWRLNEPSSALVERDGVPSTDADAATTDENVVSPRAGPTCD
jgi:hypothetical protein